MNDVLRDTRFERQLIPGNFHDQLNVVSDQTKTIIRHVGLTSTQVAQGYHGSVAKDPQFAGEITFSDDDGRSFVNPLVSPVGNRLVQIRCSIAQYQVEPRVKGFRLDWFVPDGWSWRDGLGVTTYEQVVSNPLVVTRVMLSPENPQPAVWQVLIVERFL